MSTTTDLNLVKAGIDAVLKIQTKNGRLTFQTIAPVIDTKQGYYKAVVTSGYKDAGVYARGAPVQSDRKVRLYETDFYPLRFAKAWEFDVYAKDEDVYAQMGTDVGDIAIAMRRRKNKEAANLFNNGFSSSALIYDGQPLFSTAHPGVNGGFVGTNTPATGNSLSPYSIEAVVNAYFGQFDVNGESMEFEGNLELHVGNAIYIAAKRIVSALQVAESNDNDPNVIKDYIQLHRNDKITSTTAHFYKAQTVDEHGLRTIQFSPYRITSQDEARTETVVNVVSERYRCVVLKWQGTYGDPGQ